MQVVIVKTLDDRLGGSGNVLEHEFLGEEEHIADHSWLGRRKVVYLAFGDKETVPGLELVAGKIYGMLQLALEEDENDKEVRAMGEERAVVFVFGLSGEQFIEIDQFAALGSFVLAKVYFGDLFHAGGDNLALRRARSKEGGLASGWFLTLA